MRTQHARIGEVPVEQPDERNIYITRFDRERLELLLAAGTSRYPLDGKNLKTLREELGHATVVAPEKIPADVVTMNSRVRLTDVATGEEIVFSLVFPGEADVDQHKISVLAPIGTAVLGYRVGDSISWEVPEGMTQLRIDQVIYQPEAAGRYRL